MELSNEISFGLKRLANSSIVNDEYFDKLLTEISQYLENPLSNQHTIGISKTVPRIDALKESYAALVVFFVESMRRNIDIESLKSVLSEHKFNDSRIERILELYVKHKLELQNSLQQFNSDPPNLLGVSWKLNYCVKSSFSDFDGKCLYFIELQVDKNNLNSVTKDHEVIKFACTVQQLQSLVASLRAAVRQLESISNISK
ncbi:COMM domain-containing protein 3 [Halyomorpha halys]|uniref:COMM domain-containing protein 3 n=1 Tax=Halyomorpha halys TaxID=286706 RepID=UPI0006D4DBAB|nr:COMM domain-containing protein 3 [Halyomorpha halys]